MLHRTLLFTVALSFAGAAAAGWSRTAATAETRFTGTGPAGFKIEGKTNDVVVSDDGTVLKVVVGLAKLSTGISLRDTHMREKYLEIEKFPTVALTVPLASLSIPKDGSTGEGDVTGLVTLHGVTKERLVHYKGSCTAGVCDVVGTLPLNMNEHGISVPSYLGITVKPAITVTTTFQVKRP